MDGSTRTGPVGFTIRSPSGPGPIGIKGVFPQKWGGFPSIRVLTRICVYLRVFELNSTKYAYQGRISLYCGVFWAYLLLNSSEVEYDAYLLCISVCLYSTNIVQYTFDTRWIHI